MPKVTQPPDGKAGTNPRSQNSECRMLFPFTGAASRRLKQSITYYLKRATDRGSAGQACKVLLSKRTEVASTLPWALPSWPGPGFRGDRGGRMSRDTLLSASASPGPGGSCPTTPHPGHSRSPNRQLITAWRPGALAPLPLCSAKCVMEMGPKQTSLPRGTLAHSAEDGVEGARKGGGDTEVSLLKR